MTKEQVENLEAGAAPSGADDPGESAARERSTIEFPYNDLDDALAVVKAVHTNAGVSCTLDQLAAYMKQSMTSGAFRLRVSSARIFGFTENERGAVTLTDLGRRAADPEQEAEAKADAFLRVPLYARIYDHYKGYTLPPPAALERFMREVGVSSKQTDKARQAFARSARQAGYFAHGEDRLVRPAGPGTKPIVPPTEDRKDKPENRNGGGGGGAGSGGDRPLIDPIIQGLLARLPKTGEVWPETERTLWLELLKGSFKLIYKDKSEGGSGAAKDEAAQ